MGQSQYGQGNSTDLISDLISDLNPVTNPSRAETSPHYFALPGNKNGQRVHILTAC